MTNHDLNKLFESARQTGADTSVEEISTWVGVAAGSAATGLGIAAKLKLLIAKKTFIIMASTLGIIGAISITVAMIGTAKVQSNAEEQYKKTLIEFQEKTNPSNKTVLIDESFKDSLNVIEKQPEEDLILSPLKPTEIEDINEFHIIPLAVRRLGESIVDSWSSTESNNNNTETVQGTGTNTTNAIPVDHFTKLEIEGVFDVILKQGNESSVIIDADENLQDHIEVDVRGEVLTISTGKVKIKKSNRAVVTVIFTELKEIVHNGVGDIRSFNTINCKDLELEIIGVGDAELSLNCTNLVLEYNGVGDVILDGIVTHAEFEVNGVGDLKAFDLTVENMDLEQNGVGNSEINVTNELSIDFSGVGNIRYTGKPKIKKISKSGIGSVKER